MTERNPSLGIMLMILVTLIFASQDAVSRHLASNYNILMVVMIRYWFFAAFVIWLAFRQKGSIRAAAKTDQVWTHILRGLLLVGEVCIMVVAFVKLGLVETHAVFTVYPLLVAALSGPVLGEKVGWRRWSAIGVGFIGVLVILQPGFGVFSPYALLPLISAAMFGLYNLLTRLASRRDSSATSFFWTGTVGAVAITFAGIWYMEPMTPADWGWMLVLSGLALTGHFLLIKAYEYAEASTVQPFAFFQLLFASVIGVSIFGEVLHTNVMIGAVIVVSAGVFTLIRARQVARRDARSKAKA